MLTSPINIATPLTNTDIIAFAFNIVDNVSDEIGIGLGTDGFYSRRRIQFYKKSSPKILINDGLSEEMLDFIIKNLDYDKIISDLEKEFNDYIGDRIFNCKIKTQEEKEKLYQKTKFNQDKINKYIDKMKKKFLKK